MATKEMYMENFGRGTVHVTDKFMDIWFMNFFIRRKWKPAMKLDASGQDRHNPHLFSLIIDSNDGQKNKLFPNPLAMQMLVN